VNKRLKSLMARLTPEERNGAILEVDIPDATPFPNGSAQTMLGVVREALTVRAVGEALARARQQAGLRAKDIAERLEVSGPRVAQVESNDANLTLATLLEHAQASGCEVEIVLRPHDPSLPLITAPLLGMGRSTRRRGPAEPVKRVSGSKNKPASKPIKI
jgi:transcriptional regulator with XRE-family HTH domain